MKLLITSAVIGNLIAHIKGETSERCILCTQGWLSHAGSQILNVKVLRCKFLYSSVFPRLLLTIIDNIYTLAACLPQVLLHSCCALLSLIVLLSLHFSSTGINFHGVHIFVVFIHETIQILKQE